MGDGLRRVVNSSLPGLTRQSIALKDSCEADGCPGHLARRRASRFCPGMTQRASAQHAHDVALLHDQEFLAVELDLGAGPFAEQHAVADLQVDRDQLTGLVAAARTD